MKNEIKILCPDRKCGRCRRMITRAEEVAKLTDQDISIIIENSLHEMLKYPTWILPTMVINGKIIARGYVPSQDKIRKILNATEA